MSTEERAAEVLAACRERIERGETVDSDAVLRAHPDLARRLVPGLAALHGLGAAYRAPAADAPAPSLAGRALGKYRLESVLGAGGMGTVYVAAREDGERVAVKVLHPHLFAREGFFRRFLREAELGRRVRHANVVRTLDADAAESGGERLHFLVMDLVRGRTLRELARETGCRATVAADGRVRPGSFVPEELCRHVGREIAHGLAAIHAAGVVHRDLKPENVIVTPEHVVKVMDLGVARLEDEAARLSQTGAFVGSVHYAAPEQFVGGGDDAAVDARADLFALGVVLYELATGVHPFGGDDFRTALRRVLEATPRRAGEVNPQLSPFFEELVARLLEKDRARRPASAAEVAAILDEGEESAWWRARSIAMRRETRRPLRRIRIPRETAVYGREAELAGLRSLYERAKAGDGQVVLVEGEAGIGKSRLVDEFVLSLWAAGEDTDFLFGSYPPGGAATASGAFSMAYREHLGDDEDAIRAALPQTPLLVPAFGALLRGDAAPEGVEKLTKDSLQTVFVHATRSFAAKRTTIVLVDDLHFAPEEGRALFAALALAVPGHRILLVGGARPSLDAKWLAQIDRLGHATRVPLQRLGAKDLVLLLRDSLRSEHLAEELAAKIAVKSDGNPFFVFEILRGLREGQFITKRSDGTWATTREIRDIQVPSSVVDLVQARVSDLGADDRNVLEVASCIGFEFDPSLVGDVLRIERIPALQRLGRIEKTHRLVRSAGRRFVFDHHQVMEVLYAGLSEPLREEYHAAIGTAMETRSGAASKEPKELDGAVCVDLAEHFLKGAQGARALRYLDAALTKFEKGYLNHAMIRLAELALAVPNLLAGTERVKLLLRVAKGPLHRLGRRDEQRRYIGEALQLARESGDRRTEADATGILGNVMRRLGRSAEARELYERRLALAREVGDRQGEERALGNLGMVLSDLGRYPEACELYERQLALAREIGDLQGEANVAGYLGIDLMELGRYAEAREHHERHLALARHIGNREGEAAATGNLGIVLRKLGRYAEAREHYERHVALEREVGDRGGESIATGNLGLVFSILGRFAEAREANERALALAREIGDRRVEGYWLEGRACLAAEEGLDDDAEAAWREAIALRDQIRDPIGAAGSRIALGAHLARRGRTGEARSLLMAACTTARDVGNPRTEVVALSQLAALPGGDAAAAEDAMQRLGGELEVGTAMNARLALFRANGRSEHLAEAKRLLDGMLAAVPESDRASMLANVRLYREVAGTAREQGLA